MEIIVCHQLRIKMKFFIFVLMISLGRNRAVPIDDLDLDALITSTFDTDSRSLTTPSPSDSFGILQQTPVVGDGDCECVPYYQCSANRTFIEDGEGIIDIRVKAGCESYIEVCCGGTEKTDYPITPTPPTIKPSYDVCGVRNSQGVSSLRITGDVDNEAQFGEFPWMVALTSLQEVEGSSIGTLVRVYQCGGSLLSPTVVLTAAHCVANKTGLSVRAGEWDTQTDKEPLPMQISAVRDVVIHEQYNPRSLHNDVALLLLEKPLELDLHIRPICLPSQDESMDGRQCVVSGWGKDVFGKEGKYQVILKKVEKPIVSREPCLKALRNTRLGQRFKLHESFICAGGIKGHDTCQNCLK
ncbi:phenoloxidase-activating factor 2-like isoform X2 [Macrosteles quadrilineatus]|uniref:phenoloxidase-activating factor 2-like isoform X2 n=1 Tax=Macrosteles quadrilineatus TaxID=74068 RepID=UPI0023E1A6F1|nr:phenoloxidase-activating factor 2-like isoform X2 [Macrosteles quadrilineatus]